MALVNRMPILLTHSPTTYSACHNIRLTHIIQSANVMLYQGGESAMRSRLKAQFVIPDASPLISLAKATLGNSKMMQNGETYLDLLKVFKLPIQLVDHVKWEMVHRDDKPDAKLIAQWIEKNDNIIIPITTRTGTTAANDRESGVKPLNHAGELAINEFLLEFSEERQSPDIPVLVLFEEKKVIALLDNAENVKLLSLRSFLEDLAINNLLNIKEFMASIIACDPNRGISNETIISYDQETSVTEHDIDWKSDSELSP
jgi:hypothetical protein